MEHRLLDTVLVSLTSTSEASCFAVERAGMVGAVSDTLLGPEGSGNACRLERLLGLVRVCRVLLVVGPAESSA